MEWPYTLQVSACDYISYNMVKYIPDKQYKSSNHHMDISSVLGTNGPTIPTNITNASETWMVCM